MANQRIDGGGDYHFTISAEDKARAVFEQFEKSTEASVRRLEGTLDAFGKAKSKLFDISEGMGQVRESAAAAVTSLGSLATVTGPLEGISAAISAGESALASYKTAAAGVNTVLSLLVAHPALAAIGAITGVAYVATDGFKGWGDKVERVVKLLGEVRFPEGGPGGKQNWMTQALDPANHALPKPLPGGASVGWDLTPQAEHNELLGRAKRTTEIESFISGPDQAIADAMKRDATNSAVTATAVIKAELQNLLDMASGNDQEAYRAERRHNDALEQRAKILRDSILTPQERYNRALEEANDLVNQGKLTREQGDAAANKALRDFFPRSDKQASTDTLRPTANSVESRFLTRGPANSYDPTAATAKQQLEQQAKTTDALEKLVALTERATRSLAKLENRMPSMKII
jgi:hypothetical protein